MSNSDTLVDPERRFVVNDAPETTVSEASRNVNVITGAVPRGHGFGVISQVKVNTSLTEFADRLVSAATGMYLVALEDVTKDASGRTN
jgi:hypothetical protein